MFSPLDRQMMQRALDLAARGRYTTHPNPRVGCVIARGEQIVGEAWHRKAGEAHAEPLALEAAGDWARDATVYVTLEPHGFHGKTPPCTDALIRAGVRRVVCGTLDFHPKVRGDGVRQLKAAGIDVEVGLLEEQARALNAGFEKRVTIGIPRVVVKIGSSLDGRVALASGESRWITGAAARTDVQRLRAESSAVLTGIGTVLADDPQLTVREPTIDMMGRQPLRVVLDSTLRMPPGAKMLGESGQTLILATNPGSSQAALESKGATVRTMAAAADGMMDLHAVLELLGSLECNDVLVEAGPRLAGRFVQDGLLDELIVYSAPVLLGPDARAMLQLPPLARLADRLQFELLATERIDDDLKLVLRPRKAPVP